MECNREEAIRARDIALEKFSKQDFFGARKFMVKAQQLFPTLEGLAQLLAIVEVHVVSQNKVGIGGLETDWYGILQVPAGSDDNTVKKQYRKLALLLHPDKNKATGAEAAFKLIGEAWAILSDKNKRVLHDMKRAAKVTTTNVRASAEQQKRTQQYKPPPKPPPPAPVATPVHAQPMPHIPQGHGRGAAAKFPGRPQGPNFPNDTFWTCCPSCKMQYQYHRAYHNHQLKCHRCQHVYIAREVFPVNGGVFPNHFNFGKGPVPPVPPMPPPPPPPKVSAFAAAAAAAANAANAAAAANGFANGGFGPSFPSSYPQNNAPFFSPAAAEAVAQSKVAAAAAAAAAATTSSPANNPSANVVHQTFYRVKRDRVQNKRKDKEEQLKSQDPARHQEAMDRLRAKREERYRESVKRKVDVKRRLKRKKKPSEDEEEVEEVDLDSASEIGADPSLFDDMSTPSMPRRRSSRAKKNVASYKVDEASDDSDMEDFQSPNAKRSKADGGESDGPEDETSSGRESSKRPAGTSSENGGKGKGVADDSTSGKKLAGEHGDGEKIQMPGSPATEAAEDLDGQLGKDVNASKFGAFGRDSKESESQRIKQGKCTLNEQQPGVTAKADNPQQEVGGLKDVRFEMKAPKTQRVRVNSPRVPQPPGQGVDNDDRNGLAADSSVRGSLASDRDDDKEDLESVEEDEEVSIDVPDPDFHDFDSERTEKDVHVGQIWAIYDDEDGMPRFYGRISRVNIRPFKVHLTWLEYIPHTQRSKQMMEDTGLSIGAGHFRLAKAKVIFSINTFSHVVEEKTPVGQLKVYPKKDQVWAVFRDWNAEKFRPLKIRKSRGGSNAYNYDMVLVLSDYDPENDEAVRTVKLVKVGGYKTLFQRLVGVHAQQLYKDVERFSHSVPHWALEESLIQTHGVPQGSLELDPAATPMDLINAHAPAPRAH